MLSDYDLVNQFSPLNFWGFAPISPSQPFAKFNPIQVKNQTRTNAYLDEIRFNVEFPFDIRAFLLCEIVLGANTPLCKLNQPMWTLGAEYNRQLSVNPITSSNVEDGQIVYSYQQVWRFPKPLIVAPEDSITINITLDPALIPYIQTLPARYQSTQVYVNVVGRSLPSSFVIPRYIDIPFTSFYRSPLLTFGHETEYQTAYTDLQNPFQEEFQLEKYTGRILTFGQDSFSAGIIDANESLITLRIMDNMGRGVARDFVPFAELFHSSDNCWHVNATVPPKSYQIAKIKTDLRQYASGWVNTDSVTDSTSLFDIAFSGYRSLKIS